MQGRILWQEETMGKRGGCEIFLLLMLSVDVGKGYSRCRKVGKRVGKSGVG